MSRDLGWLKRINRDDKGIWSIEYPSGSSFDAESLDRVSLPNCETAVIYVVSDEGGMKFRDSVQDLAEPDLSKIVERVSATATENARQSIRIVIGDFHNANVNERCALIKTARSLQESSTSLSVQFVFCGRWGFFAFRSAYREIHGHSTSPPADSKNVLRAPSWSADDVIKLLRERKMMEVNPSEIDHVACGFLLEQTGGDEFLIHRAIDYLQEQQGNLPSDIEQVLSELVFAPDVIDEITQRINSLEASQKSELTKLLRVHRLERPYESIDSEQLWLAGLVQRHKLHGGKQCIQVAGPLINTVVRHILESEKRGTVATPNYLCIEREAISTAAYRKIAQIENLLRNLIVSEWYAEKGDTWSENLMGTKTSSHDWEEQEDLIRLATSLVKSELGIAPDDVNTELTTSRRAQQKTILESAQDWQRRQKDSHAVELANDNLMHFLTTEALVSLLVSKRNGFYGEGRPFKKDYLSTALGEYIEIRSAVAHNRPIKLSTISRLDELQRKFINWLTVFADQVTTCEQEQLLEEDG